MSVVFARLAGALMAIGVSLIIVVLIAMLLGADDDDDDDGCGDGGAA